MTGRTKKGGARAIADVTGGTILATVEIAASQERVFRALTDPREVVRWWGSPDTYQTTEWQADLRPGGSFQARGVGADGHAFGVAGEYLVVDPPHKLSHTWKPDWENGQVTTVSYLLEAIAAGTRVTLRHDGFVGRPESCRSHGDGWERVLGWLDAYAAAPSAGASAPQYFLSKLIGPRPTFPGDMTERERKVMGEHVAYWTELLERGTAVAFGPVFDPNGPWGAGIVAVSSEDELLALQAKDPVTLAELGFRHECYPMPGAIVRP